MKTNSAMTIYNKYIEGGAEKWQRTTIPFTPAARNGVKWENRKGANVLKSGLIQADSVVIYMPMTSAVYYVAPITWQALTVRTGLFTLQMGDFIARGEITQDITDKFRITQLKAAYDQVIKITSVDQMDSGLNSMHHFQIGGS